MNKKQISKYIFLDTTPQKSDIGLVMGTTKTYTEAAKRTWNLYKKGVIQRIIISGGINRNNKNNESTLLKNELLNLGIPEDVITLEQKSTNTLENVIYSRNLIQKKIGFSNINSILVIARNYHSRRVLMTFKKHFPKTVKIYISTYTSKKYPFLKSNWYKTKLGTQKVNEELKKIKKYLKKGDIEEL